MDPFTDALKDYTNLSDLLEVREVTYTGITQTIMKPYETVLTNIIRAISTHENPIYWQSVDRVVGLPEFITVGGYVLPVVGTTIKTKTDDVIVTDSNVMLFKSEVRMILPIKLLQNGTELELINFVRQFAAISAVSSGDELLSILRQYVKYEHEELFSKEYYMQLLDNATRPTEIEGFNASHLTDDQMSKMRLYSNTYTETKH